METLQERFWNWHIPWKITCYQNIINTYIYWERLMKSLIVALAKHWSLIMLNGFTTLNNFYKILILAQLWKCTYIVIKHVQKFVEKYGRGLKYFSKEPFESVHADWNKYFGNFSCNPSHENFASKLLRAFVKYNARNI